jgi:hypothetical protein
MPTRMRLGPYANFKFKLAQSPSLRVILEHAHRRSGRPVQMRARAPAARRRCGLAMCPSWRPGMNLERGRGSISCKFTPMGIEATTSYR